MISTDRRAALVGVAGDPARARRRRRGAGIADSPAARATCGEGLGRVMLVRRDRHGVDGRALAAEGVETPARPCWRAGRRRGGRAGPARGNGRRRPRRRRIVGAVEPQLRVRREAGRGSGPAAGAAAGRAIPPSPSRRASAASGMASRAWCRSIATASAAFIAWWLPARRGRGRLKLRPAVAIGRARRRRSPRPRRRRAAASARRPPPRRARDRRGERVGIMLGEQRHAGLGDAALSRRRSPRCVSPRKL